MRRLLCSAALVAALPALAAAQDRPTLWDLFSPDLILQSAMQSGLMALRTQMDLQYSDMTVDLLSGRIAILDVTAWPLPDWDDDGTCQIDLSRLVLSSGPLDRLDQIQLAVQVSGFEMPISCLPPDARQPFEMASLDMVDVPRLTLDITYGVPASDGSVRLHADVTGAGQLDVQADFAYIWVDGRDQNDPQPVMFLDHAMVALTDAGLFNALRGLLPPPLTAEGGGLFIEGALGQELINMNRQATGSETLTEAQAAFLSSLSASWGAFVQDPQTLVVETNIDGDVYLDFEVFQDNPVEIFETLMPRVSLAPAARSEILPVELLSAGLSGGADLSEDERRTTGTALLTGVGAPRNIAAGEALLGALAEAGDGAAAMTLAQALEHIAPDRAYRFGLLAGKGSAKGTAALLDRLERELPFARVLALQTEVSGKDKHSGETLGDVSAMRAEALMRFSGLGRARSYEITALWAILAAASGDAEARALLSELDEKVRLSGPDAAAAWATAETRASGLASQVWVDRDLPSQLAQ